MIGFLCCLVLRESDNKVNLSTPPHSPGWRGKHQADPLEKRCCYSINCFGAKSHSHANPLRVTLFHARILLRAHPSDASVPASPLNCTKVLTIIAAPSFRHWFACCAAQPRRTHAKHVHVQVHTEWSQGACSGLPSKACGSPYNLLLEEIRMQRAAVPASWCKLG